MNSKHWFTTFFIGRRCQKAMLGDNLNEVKSTNKGSELEFEKRRAQEYNKEDLNQAPTRKTKAAVDSRQNNKMLIKAVSVQHCTVTPAPHNCCHNCYAEQSQRQCP